MFDFSTAGRILFGCGMLEQAAPSARQFGKRTLVVTGHNDERCMPLLDALCREGVQPERFIVSGEPTTDAVTAAADAGKKARCTSVIAFGGGSPIDLAKAAAALITNPGDLFDYLEVIGLGQPLTHDPVPMIAIPTTAGTGAEVTKNSVITSPQHRVKVSLRHDRMLPDLAIVDPLCTVGLPPAVTAASGLDALTQLIESFISRKANALTDGFCREGLPRAIRSLRRAVEDGTDIQAREEMALAALLSGLALANAGLGAVHGFSGPLGGWTGAPHGELCAALLPSVLRINLEALIQRDPASPALERLAEFGRMTGGETAEDGILWIEALCHDLHLPPFSACGLARDDISSLAAQAARSSSMKSNPIDLTDSERIEILYRAFSSTELQEE